MTAQFDRLKESYQDDPDGTKYRIFAALTIVRDLSSIDAETPDVVRTLRSLILRAVEVVDHDDAWNETDSDD